MNNAPRTDATATKPFKGQFNQACCRCGGSGVWQGWRRGVCFRCGGHGIDPTPSREWVFPASWTGDKIDEFYAKKNEQAAKRAAKKTDARQARMEAACAAYPSVAALRISWLAEDDTEEAKLWYAVSNAATDIMWKAFQYDLSEAQVALLDKQVAKATEYLVGKAVTDAERAAAKAAAKPVPTGRVVITGEVVSMKWYDGDFGTTCKLLIVGADGWKVFVTRPASLSDVNKGDIVSMTCDVTAADDDPTFGKGKRPTKASIAPLTEAEGFAQCEELGS